MDGIQPAQLSFLAIYNPSLGPTEETSYDQIVYYYSSRSGRARKAREANSHNAEELQNEERNEQMRQVGLAQGMVNFAREFSNGNAVDYIDTEKARIFVHELEPGWWILASVDLTQVETVSTTQDNAKSGQVKSIKKTEYSTRELCPQPLLLKQVLRGHGIFLLHHGSSLADIFERRGRPTLSTALEKFWNRFIRYWDVLMQGSPAVEIFNCLNLASGGELGFGVGEEEWGSGERDVLEDIVKGTDGLVDMVVSRFGDPPSEKVIRYEEQPEPWMGTGAFPSASDGVIFSGVGAVARIDIIRISAWMEWLYRFGIGAYGVQDNPQSARKKRRKRAPHVASPSSPPRRGKSTPAPTSPLVKGIPPPIFPSPGYVPEPVQPAPKVSTENLSKEDSQSYVDSETLMKYMTLGIYGSSWGIPSGRPSPARTPSVASKSKGSAKKDDNDDDHSTLDQVEPQSLEEQARQRARRHPDVTRGCFIVGLKGDLSAPVDDDEEEELTDNAAAAAAAAVELSAASEDSSRRETAASRIQLRTLHMTRNESVDLPSLSTTARLRVVVYARQPFIYTFLFDAKSQPGLALPSFYRNIHNQLTPLQRPLLRTTSPADVRRRLLDAAGSQAAQSAIADTVAPVWDLVYDPSNGTCHTSLPSIPDVPENPAAGGATTATAVTRPKTVVGDLTTVPWTRAEALAIHGLLVRIWQDTRHRPNEFERTLRTGRGWWVVWMRLPATDNSHHRSSGNDDDDDGGGEGGADAGAGAACNRGATSAEAADPADTTNTTTHARGTGPAPPAGSGDTGDTTTGVQPDADDDNSSMPHQPSATTAAGKQAEAQHQHQQQQQQQRQQRPHVQNVGMLREAFLVRRAVEKPPRGGKGFLASFGMNSGGSGTNSGGKDGDGSRLSPARLAEGIGIDARRYVEGLFSLNR